MISIAIICLLFVIARSQPSNNHPCDAIEVTGSLPLVYPDASSIGADTVFEDDLPLCFTSITSPSVWYKINGVSSLFVETDFKLDYDTKLTLWVAEQCDDPDTFTCIDGNDDCDGFLGRLGVGSCVDGGVNECFDEVLIELHAFGGAEGTADLNITGTRNVFACDNCGHTWNTGPNKEVQCISDDVCCEGLSCNPMSGKCNVPGLLCGEIICGHIRNSGRGPNAALNCNDEATRCCDGFRCNENNGKCLKKLPVQSASILSAGTAETSTLCASDGALCNSNPGGCCSGSCCNGYCVKNKKKKKKKS